MKGHFHHGSVDAQRKYMTVQGKKLYYANSVFVLFVGACFDCINTESTILYIILIGLDEEEDCDISGNMCCVWLPFKKR